MASDTEASGMAVDRGYSDGITKGSRVRSAITAGLKGVVITKPSLDGSCAVQWDCGGDPFLTNTVVLRKLNDTPREDPERIRREATRPEIASAFTEQVGGNHYKKTKLQPMDYITANKLGFVEGSVVKYITRYADKGGAEDLKKIIHYTRMLLESEYKVKSRIEFEDE